MLRLMLALAALAPNGDAAHPESLAGTYDGSQTEIAAGLDLRPDGRFDYGLSYGALDEEGHGDWHVENGRVVLTSDPVTPPHLTLQARTPAPAGILRAALDAPPGIPHGLFTLRIAFADGREAETQLGEDDTELPLPRTGGVAQASVSLPMFDLESAAVPIAEGQGAHLRFRFEPNDLGKADFRATPLAIEGDTLLLSRHGREIRFRRTPPGESEAPEMP